MPQPRILVVDDRKGDRLLIREQLREAGYDDICECAYGKKALGMLGLGGVPVSPAVDLVILDVLLPDISGFRVCEQIKQQLSPLFPVIMLTGLYDVSHHVRGIEAGADDFFSKTLYQPDELAAKIKMLLHYCSSQKEHADEQLTLAHIRSRPSPGDRIGDYRIIATLGWGGGTLVYKAREIESERTVVIKLLSRHMMEDWSGLQRFTREMKVMQRLSHVNLISVIDDGIHVDCPYYVMEFFEGQDLFEHINGRPGRYQLVHRIAHQVAHALEYVHDRKIIHRDIKPRNIFLCANGSVKLGDFGIAKFGESKLTQTNVALGTPVYMAPEQFTDAPLTRTADIYAYGATLYHLISGQPPFDGLDTYELFDKHLTEKPVDLTRLVPSLPQEWANFVVDRCMAKAVTDRPQSMAEVLDLLQALPVYEA